MKKIAPVKILTQIGKFVNQLIENNILLMLAFDWLIGLAYPLIKMNIIIQYNLPLNCLYEMGKFSIDNNVFTKRR